MIAPVDPYVAHVLAAVDAAKVRERDEADALAFAAECARFDDERRRSFFGRPRDPRT